MTEVGGRLVLPAILAFSPQTEAMLKYRLLFGSLMTVLFSGLVLLDGWFDGSLTASPVDDRQVQATLLTILVAGIMSLGGLGAVQARGLQGPCRPEPRLCHRLDSAVHGVVLAPRRRRSPRNVSAGGYGTYACGMCCCQQQLRFGVSGVLANCGISCFSLLYLGLLGSFVLGIRIDGGLWEFLGFMFAVKASDIGAYTFGRLFGKHKLAPRVSPGKTWEGLAGAVAAAIVVSLAFALVFGIMKVWLAPVFGAVHGRRRPIERSGRSPCSSATLSRRIPRTGCPVLGVY